MNLVRYSLLLAALATGVARADWTYNHTDDFASDKAQAESYLHSTFWLDDVNPLPEPYLAYTGTGAARGLLFMDYKGQLAELGYRFPLTTQARRIVRGTVQVDVSFPHDADGFSSSGQLFWSTSIDGAAWSAPEPLWQGRHEIPIGSSEGVCYVRFTGGKAVIDNLRVYLYSPNATIRVPSNFRTIQEAIDAAGNDDIIEVADGTYTGPGNRDIDFRGKRITVRSASGPQNTIIDCGRPTAAAGKGHRGFYFHLAETADSVLSGFTVRGGRVYGSQIPPDPLRWSASAAHPIGGGIYCELSSPTIVNCVINDCGAELGGGIGAVGSAPVITDCRITECVAGGLNSVQSGGRGAGIALVGQCNATIASCTIEKNSAYRSSQGAGIYILQSSAVVAGCTLSSNNAPGSLQGGGAYCGGAATDVTFQNCVFSWNAADAGAGLFAERYTSANPSFATAGSCSVSIINCTIAGNQMSEGVYATGADLIIRNSIVWYNAGTPVVILSPGYATSVTYSDIQNGYPGTGNISEDPGFAATSTPDYHLQSNYGRYDPRAGRWVTDTSHSPCIDAGDPTSSAAEEPVPNGDRVNMGAYGGTKQASKGVEHFVYHVNGRFGSDWNSGTVDRPFKTVGQGIDRARDGDIVLVWPGVYDEELTLNRKAITVQSAADAAVIRAPDGYAFSFFNSESNRSVVKNFVITGCPVGAVFCSGASPTLKNLTIVGNQFGISGFAGADPNIINCIIWGNTSGSLSQCSAWYSCVQQKYTDDRFWKAGNINSDPLFADPTIGDYHLRSQHGRYVPQTDTWAADDATSPCIDAGDPTEDPRDERLPNGGRVNMGAYGATPYASRNESSPWGW
jgi:hypothetical protein